MTAPTAVTAATMAARPALHIAASASADVQALAADILAVSDHGELPFVIIDKVNARLWLFASTGEILGSSAVLLGAAIGDDSVPGIGERPLEAIAPHERTTPAGRFVSEPGKNADGEDVIWVDYEAAVSMHRVRATQASERRLRRLASATARDNRISWGCINVPAAFYDGLLSPTLARHPAVVYVLPETRPLQAVFPFAD